MDPVVWILLLAIVAGVVATMFVTRRRQGTRPVDGVRAAQVGAEADGHHSKIRQDSGTI